DHTERDQGDQQGNRGLDVMGLEPADVRGEPNEAEQRRDDDYSVDACPLPVTAAEMQPHPELIEGQRQSNAVNERRDTERLPGGPAEKQVRAHAHEQEDAVVE